ncbi:hypothetical protein AABB24_007421 [Solanum stoloniferum]|uniref:Uncharacterized protein n=1 Tax=Solanum stoloniferum TaxID=62892 RepID=A0ABD2UNH0_9SOLN
MTVGEDQIQIGSWSMHNGCLFGTNDFNIFVKHQSIVNHFDMATPTLFGLDALLVLLLVILLCVLNNNKVMCQIQRHTKQWCVIFIRWLIKQNHSVINHQWRIFTYFVQWRGKGGVAGRRARAAERGQVPVEMDEAVLEDYQATGDIGSTSRSHTQEFTPGMTYQPTNSEIVPYMTPQISRDPSLSSLENVFGNYRPQHFENVPNFTSSPVPMSMEILDVMTNLEDSNIEIEGNELDDSNNEVDGNDPENASGGGEPSVKKKRTIFPKFCGTGSHQLNQHVIKKTTKGNKDTVATKRRSKE